MSGPVAPSSRFVALVCVGYSPPSVRHVPWQLTIAGRPTLAVVLRRLRLCLEAPATVVLNADPIRRHQIEDIAAQEGAETFFTGSCAITQVLRAFARQRAEFDVCTLFLDAAPLVAAHETKRLIQRHVASGADCTLPEDLLLDGVLPVILTTAHIGKLLGLCGESANLRTLTAQLRSVATSKWRVLHVGVDALSDAIPDALPTQPLVSDCWTQDAAEYALAREASSCGTAAAVLFKARLLSSLDKIPDVAPLPRADGRRTVLFASSRLAFSGGEQSLLLLMRGLDRGRFAPTLLVPYDCLLATKAAAAGIPVIIAGWDYSTPTARNLSYCERILDTLAPSLVHVDALPTPALMISARARRTPVIGHLRIQPGYEVSPFTYLTKRIIAISDAVSARLRRFTVRPENITVVHNGVDRQAPTAARITRHSLGVPDDACVFAVVSRLTPTKRLELFFEAMEQVILAFPNTRAVIFGEASAGGTPYGQDDVLYAEDLRAMVDARRWGDHVHWLGFQPDLQPFYGIVDCLVACNPREGLGRCTLEAMAEGIAVIGPDEGGSAEIIHDGVDGLLFLSESADSLAAAMTRLCGDRALRHDLARAGRRRATDFTVGAHVRGVEAVYAEVLAERGHAPPNQ